MSLQSRLLDLIMAIGADITDLTIRKNQITCALGAGASTSIPQNAYTKLPAGSSVISLPGSVCFRANADGTVSILQTGWYYTEVSILGPASVAFRGGLFVNSSDSTPANPLSGITFFEEIQGNPSTAAIHSARMTQFSANSRLIPAVYNRSAAASFQVLNMSVFKV